MIKNEINYVEAVKNVRDFDFREVEHFVLFNYFREELVKSLNKVTDFRFKYAEQVKFARAYYDCERESDGKFYPSICLTFDLRGCCYNAFCLKLTPFNTKLIDQENPYWECPEIDAELTALWHAFMRDKYDLTWSRALIQYNLATHTNRKSHLDECVDAQPEFGLIG